MRIDDTDNIWKLPLYRCICYYLSLSVILHRYPCNTADTSIPSHYCKWKKCCMIVKHLCKSYHFSSQQNKLCDKAEKAIVLPPFFPIFLMQFLHPNHLLATSQAFVEKSFKTLYDVYHRHLVAWSQKIHLFCTTSPMSCLCWKLLVNSSRKAFHNQK